MTNKKLTNEDRAKILEMYTDSSAPLTQREIAEHFGISQAAVSVILSKGLGKTGKKPAVASVQKYAGKGKKTATRANETAEKTQKVSAVEPQDTSVVQPQPQPQDTSVVQPQPQKTSVVQPQATSSMQSQVELLNAVIRAQDETIAALKAQVKSQAEVIESLRETNKTQAETIKEQQTVIRSFRG